MNLIRLLIKASWPVFAVSFVSSVLAGVCSTLIIRLIHLAINGRLESIQIFVVWFTLCLVGYMVFSLIGSYTISKLTRQVIHEMRTTLSNAILRADVRQLETRRSRLLPILTDDITSISIVIERLPSVANGAATVLGILVYMAWLSPSLFLATIGAFTAIVVFNRVALRIIGRYSALSREHTNQVYKGFEGLTQGLNSLKQDPVFRRSYQTHDIDNVSRVQTAFYGRYNVVQAMMNRGNDLILFAFLGVVIVLISTTGFIEMAFFNTYLTLILFMLAPLSTISGFLSNMKRVDATLSQMKEMGLAMEQEPPRGQAMGRSLGGREPDAPTPSPLGAPPAQLDSATEQPALISLRGIRYAYFDGRLPSGVASDLIGPFELDVHQGEILFIAGGNGSGKTTLIKLLSGLYLPAEGALFYRGSHVDRHSDDEMDAYRSRFGVVFTDGYVFDHLHHISEERVDAWAGRMLSALGLQGVVEIREGRFSSVQLSEGQKKRLQLFRVLLEEKEVYVFDEWPAYQDQETKALFFNDVLPMLKREGKTVVNISHDSGYESVADRIVRLNEGRMAD